MPYKEIWIAQVSVSWADKTQGPFTGTDSAVVIVKDSIYFIILQCLCHLINKRKIFNGICAGPETPEFLPHVPSIFFIFLAPPSKGTLILIGTTRYQSHFGLLFI